MGGGGQLKGLWASPDALPTGHHSLATPLAPLIQY